MFVYMVYLFARGAFAFAFALAYGCCHIVLLMLLLYIYTVLVYTDTNAIYASAMFVRRFVGQHKRNSVAPSSCCCCCGWRCGVVVVVVVLVAVLVVVVVVMCKLCAQARLLYRVWQPSHRKDMRVSAWRVWRVRNNAND